MPLPTETTVRITRAQLHGDSDPEEADGDAIAEYEARMRAMFAAPEPIASPEPLPSDADDTRATPDVATDSDDSTAMAEDPAEPATLFRLFARSEAVAVQLGPSVEFRGPTHRPVLIGRAQRAANLHYTPEVEAQRIVDATIDYDRIIVEAKIPWERHFFPHKLVPAAGEPQKPRSQAAKRRQRQRKTLATLKLPTPSSRRSTRLEGSAPKTSRAPKNKRSKQRDCSALASIRPRTRQIIPKSTLVALASVKHSHVRFDS
ncbi:hypothetical protein H4R33_005843 [Dimargaris cristalligena]|uniref:Uncharacterized protein n=1 Tax=Dimargaris cristalligena TaxID=215637 RepID=A0A4P9ZQQ7_9FUNG|nr:hypothetical protein H4R33_005843 [Dimargaris cristalligena]RKP35824.1 hypothetical protein BJ085DRAFT_28424 [Dimargaris cristalligena]|eukprot:RKP35824.1 hypothetical protein BJ085DRAFT_28424 [Dimargaris cristalligena]